MGREARLKVENKDSWYFLHAKILPTIKKGTLSEAESGDKLLSIIKLNAKAFECELAGVFISKYHFALVVKFRRFKELHQSVLLRNEPALDEDKQVKVDQRRIRKVRLDFNKRLFDVSKFMHTIQMSFARWSNRKFNRIDSKLWAERFKSTILTNDDSALDALLYVESGAIREKDFTSLDYKYSSYSLRSSKKNSDWLMPIEGILSFAKGAKSISEYEQMLNHRVNLPVNSIAIVDKEIKNGYEAGCYLKSQSYLLNGLVIGTEKEIKSWIYILKMKKEEKEKEKKKKEKEKKDDSDNRKTKPNKQEVGKIKKPYKLEVGSQYSIREQRSHSVT